MLVASATSIGGLGALPMLHQVLVEQRPLLSEQEFATALAVSRFSPGPNGLFVVSLGYFLAGLPGAAAATLAALFPPLAVLPLHALYRRYRHLPRVEGMAAGAGLAVVGLFLAISLQILRATVVGPVDLAIAAAAFALIAFTRVDAVPILVGAAAVGAALLVLR